MLCFKWKCIVCGQPVERGDLVNDKGKHYHRFCFEIKDLVKK
jgi:hypothetical protein